MAIGFRHSDARFPFFWESTGQPSARWHAAGDGPVQYLADTPDGAWAEFLRHEEITEPADLAGIIRRIWAVQLPVEIGDAVEPQLPEHILLGGTDTYASCQDEARRLRAAGADAIEAPSAALRPGGARGQFTRGGLVEAPDVDGVVWAIFGAPPDSRGWAAVDVGAPTARLLPLVRHFGDGPPAAGRPSRSDRRSGRERRTTIDITQERLAKPERRTNARRGRGGSRPS